LDAFGKRKRKVGRFLPAGLELARADAEWLAVKVQRGMFGTSRQGHIPPPAKAFCRQCAVSIAKKRGAPKQQSARLDAAIARQRRNTADPISPVDPRWLKRLKKRKREEAELTAWFERGGGLWAAPLGGKNSP
jgi:hypothetical protein